MMIPIYAGKRIGCPYWYPMDVDIPTDWVCLTVKDSNGWAVDVTDILCPQVLGRVTFFAECGRTALLIGCDAVLLRGIVRQNGLDNIGQTFRQTFKVP